MAGMLASAVGLKWRPKCLPRTCRRRHRRPTTRARGLRADCRCPGLQLGRILFRCQCGLWLRHQQLDPTTRAAAPSASISRPTLLSMAQKPILTARGSTAEVRMRSVAPMWAFPAGNAIPRLFHLYRTRAVRLCSGPGAVLGHWRRRSRRCLAGASTIAFGVRPDSAGLRARA